MAPKLDDYHTVPQWLMLLVTNIFVIHIASSTEILSGEDTYIRTGDMINLTCLISDANAPPKHIFWYHKNEVISYYSKRGGVSIVNDKGVDVTYSQLLIRDANQDDQVRSIS